MAFRILFGKPLLHFSRRKKANFFPVRPTFTTFADK